MTSISEESTIKSIYCNSADLLLSLTLSKITSPVTLEEAKIRIASHIDEYEDPTILIRNMRDRDYDL